MSDWAADAACRGMDTNLFFPKGTVDRDARRKIEAAKKVCAECPVRRQCREVAVGELYGVWGGLTPEDRGVRMPRSGREEPVRVADRVVGGVRLRQCGRCSRWAEHSSFLKHVKSGTLRLVCADCYEAIRTEVLEALARGGEVDAIAQRFGITARTLYRWKGLADVQSTQGDLLRDVVG